MKKIRFDRIQINKKDLVLLDVSTGKTTVDEVVELLGGHREEEEE